MEQMKFKPEHYEQVFLYKILTFIRNFNCKYFKNMYRPGAVSIYEFCS